MPDRTMLYIGDLETRHREYCATPAMTFEIVSVETKYEGWGRYLALCVRLPNGEVVRREIEDHGRAVAVLAFDVVEARP